MTFVLVQRGSWPGWSPNADIYLDSRAAAAFLTAARDYMKATGRPMPEIAEPMGGLRTVAETTEMQWAFDYGPHGIHGATATTAQRARSDALYAHYNMSRVSTARPSIAGTHTTGLFFDVATAAFLTWLLAGNGARYGITRPLLNDPNHCQFHPGTETAALDVASLDGGAAAPVRTPPMSDTRLILAHHLTPAPFFYRVQLGTGALTASQYTQEQANLAAQAIGAQTFEVNSDAELKALQAVLASIPSTTVTGASVDLSGFATAAQVAEIEAKVSAIKVPTKGTVELA